MKKENRKAAQERRAKERARQRRKSLIIRWTVAIVIIVAVVALIVAIVRSSGSDSDSSSSSGTSVSTSSTSTSVSDSSSASSSSTASSSSAQSLNTTEGTVVSEGDTVAIHYVGKTADGTLFYGGTGDYDLTLGSGSFIDGFEEQVEGHSVGETFDISVTFPENYSSTYAMNDDGTQDTSQPIDLAGADAVFTVTINGVYE